MRYPIIVRNIRKCFETLVTNSYRVSLSHQSISITSGRIKWLLFNYLIQTKPLFPNLKFRHIFHWFWFCSKINLLLHIFWSPFKRNTFYGPKWETFLINHWFIVKMKRRGEEHNWIFPFISLKGELNSAEIFSLATKTEYKTEAKELQQKEFSSDLFFREIINFFVHQN